MVCLGLLSLSCDTELLLNSDIIPRELTIQDGFLHIAPISELETIRRNQATTTHTPPSQPGEPARTLIRGGSHHIELRLNCTLKRDTPLQPSSRVRFRVVLASS